MHPASWECRTHPYSENSFEALPVTAILSTLLDRAEDKVRMSRNLKWEYCVTELLPAPDHLQQRICVHFLSFPLECGVCIAHFLCVVL